MTVLPAPGNAIEEAGDPKLAAQAQVVNDAAPRRLLRLDAAACAKALSRSVRSCTIGNAVAAGVERRLNSTIVHQSMADYY